MPSGLFSPRISSLGERCPTCPGESCDDLLGGEATVQQLRTSKIAKGEALDINDIRQGKIWTLGEFARIGCTKSTPEVEALIGVVSGDEEVRLYANDILGYTITLPETEER